VSWRVANQLSSVVQVFSVPFNSTNKFQLSVHQLEKQPALFLALKGAPERVIARCSRIFIAGEEQPLVPELLRKFEQMYAELGGKGERVLGFACRRLDPLKYSSTFEFTELAKQGPDSISSFNFPADDLCFVGLVSLLDPPRETVPHAIAKCRTSGIKVRSLLLVSHSINADYGSY
jgi:magnesium-transporting ATPase (P-type)